MNHRFVAHRVFKKLVFDSTPDTSGPEPARIPKRPEFPFNHFVFSNPEISGAMHDLVEVLQAGMPLDFLKFEVINASGTGTTQMSPSDFAMFLKSKGPITLHYGDVHGNFGNLLVFFLLTGGLEVCGKNTIEKRAAIAGFQSALIEFSKQFEFDVLENIYKIKPHPSTRIPDVIAELRSRLAGCFRPTEYSLSGKLKYHLIGDEICDRGPWPDTLMIDLLSIFNIFVISGPPVTVFESNHGIGYGLRLSDPPYKQHVQSYRNTIRMCFESPPQDAISQIIDHFETILVRRAEYLQLVGLHTMGTHFHVVTHAPAPYDAIQTVARELIKHPAIPSDYHASLQILADSAIDALTPGELGKCFETMNTAYRTLLKSQFQLISDALHSLPLKQAKSDILVARPDRETLCTLVIKTVQTKFVEGLQLTDTKPTAHSPLYLALAKLLEHRQAPTERWGNYGRIFGHSQVSVPFPLYHCLDTEQGKFACLWRQSNFPFETDPHHRVVTLPRPILVTDAGGAPLADRPLTPRE